MDAILAYGNQLQHQYVEIVAANNQLARQRPAGDILAPVGGGGVANSIVQFNAAAGRLRDRLRRGEPIAAPPVGEQVTPYRGPRSRERDANRVSATGVRRKRTRRQASGGTFYKERYKGKKWLRRRNQRIAEV